LLLVTGCKAITLYARRVPDTLATLAITVSVLAITTSEPTITLYSLVMVDVSLVVSIETGITPVVVSTENQYQLFNLASNAMTASLLNRPLLVDVAIEFEYNH